MPDSHLARSGITDTDGKFSKRLDVPMTEQMYDDLVALAALRGIPKAEAVRRVAQEIECGNGRNFG